MRIEFKNTRSCGEDPGQGVMKIKVKTIRNKRQQKKNDQKVFRDRRFILQKQNFFISMYS